MVRRRAVACSRRNRRGAYRPPVLHNNKTREDNILPYTMTGKRSGGSPFASKCAPALRYEIDFSAKVAETMVGAISFGDGSGFLRTRPQNDS